MLTLNQGLQIMIALPLVFILPGYAIIAAIFPDQSLSLIERLLYSLGLSLTIMILGGLGLHATPWGMQKYSWICFIAIVTLSASGVALYRRWSRHTTPSRAKTGLSLHQGLLLTLSLVVLISAIGVAYYGAQQQQTLFTQLWIMPADKVGANTVRLGVDNFESVEMTYQLKLTEGNAEVNQWQYIRLAPGERWDTTVELPSEPSASTIVEAVLYRIDVPNQPYRIVTLSRSNQKG